MKRALIFIGYFALILMLLGAGGAGYLFYNQDKIIAGGVAKLNERLKAPVAVSTIELDLFSGFPRIRIVLNQVQIEDPFGGKHPLIAAQEVGLGMNVLEVLRGTYTIEELAVSTGEIHLIHSKLGDNWDLLNSTDSSNSDLTLQYLEANAVSFTYDDRVENSTYSSNINYLEVSGVVGHTTQLSLSADLSGTYATIEGDVFLVDAPLRGKAALTIDENWTLSTMHNQRRAP